MKLKKAIKDFLTYLESQGKRRATIANYQRYLSRFMNFTGNIEVQKITPALIIEFQNHISQEGYAPSTANYHSVALRSFLTYLHKIEVPVPSPTVVDLPKFDRKEVTYLNPQELKAILEAPNPTKKGYDWAELRDRAILETLASTGCRISEICSLKVEGLDLKRGEIRIKTTKGRKPHLAFLTENAQKYLRLWLEKRSRQDEDCLFYSCHSNSGLTPRTVQRSVKRYARLAGITKDVHPHTFRHTRATTLLQRGMNIKEVKEILGHRSIMSTQIYTHVSDEGLKKSFKQACSAFATNSAGEPYKNEYIVMSKESFYKLTGMIGKIYSTQKEILEKLK